MTSTSPRQTPFASEEPISRSLFVKRAFATKRLCFLIGVVTAGMAGLLAFDEAVEAACPPPASDGFIVTTLVADHPVQVNAGGDPDFESVLKENARIAVQSGAWAQRLREKEASLAAWYKTPRFPETRPQSKTTLFTRTPTGLALDRIPQAALLSGFSRVYLIFDAGNGSQMAFAEKLLAHANLPVRPIVAGGSVEAARTTLGTRVWADQGSVITRRLGLNFWPALVKLTASEIAIWTPALNDEGIPHDPVPAGLLSEGPIDLSAPAVRPRLRPVGLTEKRLGDHAE